MATLTHDPYCGRLNQKSMRQVAQQSRVDAVLDSGDITDWVSQPENQLVTCVGQLGVGYVYVYVRGTHDSGAMGALIAELPTLSARRVDDGDGGRRSRRTGRGRSNAEVDDTPECRGTVQQLVQQRAPNSGASGRTPANVTGL
ncbi:hypothetical protein [Geodermatophilus obscurus]|uniref:hypothetical protein n=1 Tax=Geodermatophilus obscurus TaxID=1861 RepID=UPI000942DA98|nr:hypothetical protein [Geodermatophilus obscurus]